MGDLLSNLWVFTPFILGLTILVFLACFLSNKILSKQEQSPKKEFWTGFAWVLIFHIIYCVINCVIFASFLILSEHLFTETHPGVLYNITFLPWACIFVIWLAQILYILPILIVSDKRRRFDFSKGVLMAAGITFLIGSGTCASLTIFR